MLLFESNLERTCATCGSELGFRRYKARIGSQYRFCTIAHLEQWIIKREEAARALQAAKNPQLRLLRSSDDAQPSGTPDAQGTLL